MTTAPIPTAELESIVAVSEFDGLVVYEDYRRLAAELIAAREAIARLINPCGGEEDDIRVALSPSPEDRTDAN